MPPLKKRKRVENMNIPPELVEKVLLNLPFKSLSRFSTVSKSWNSTIHSRDFAKRYRGRAMIVMKLSSDPDAALVYPLSSISSDNPKADFSGVKYPRVRASCGELWCVQFEDGSVCLYNPSTRTRRKLAESPTPKKLAASPFIYGLGYDAATDDYKVLKFNKYFSGNSELYSQRSDSWRMLGGSREDIRACMSTDAIFYLFEDGGVSVNGSLHWIIFIRSNGINGRWVQSILSFDLSTEKYGKVALPETVGVRVAVSVLRGKLCVYSDYMRQRGGVMWVLHEGGLWSKEMVFNYSHIFPNICPSYLIVRPLQSYDSDSNSNNKIKAFAVTTADDCITKIVLCEDDLTQLVEKDFGCRIIHRCFTYVESMVKP